MVNFNWRQAGGVKCWCRSESGIDMKRLQDNNRKIGTKAKSIDFTHSNGFTPLVKSTNNRKILTR
jgi:hypothetical protein